MKFRCGYTKQDVYRFKKGYKWFAWYPVRCEDGHCLWLEFVIKSYPYSWWCPVSKMISFGRAHYEALDSK